MVRLDATPQCEEGGLGARAFPGMWRGHVVSIVWLAGCRCLPVIR